MKNYLLRPLLISTLLLTLACEEKDPYVVSDGGVGEGDPCSASVECRGGLVCSGYSTCKKLGESGTGGIGKRCATYVDCQRDFACDVSKWSCVTPGSAKDGDACKAPHECDKGLVCSSAGKCSALGKTGAKAHGTKCDKTSDCVVGLVCVEAKCLSPSYWAGVTCGKDEGTFRALFEIPRASKKTTEFYRLPFPNDVRRGAGGRVDVTGHPDPGLSLPTQYKDVVKNFYEAINKDVTGFGVNTAVLLRMSHSFDLNSLTLIGLNPTVQFLNIDKSSPGYGKGVGMTMFATTARGKYICQNVIALRPNIGSPLLPKTTYAVLLRRGIKTKASEEAEPDTDFSLMLKAGEPMAGEEKTAWQAYKPLRDYLTDKKIPVKTLIGAAVFTTMDPRERLGKLRAQIEAKMATPKVAGMVICDGKLTSPCDDAKLKTHACPTSPSNLYDELQASVEVPVMQKGTRPYKKVSDLGYIEYDGTTGKPVIQEKEKLCVTMTIPKGTMPAGGWPVVIYGHGTGGHFRSFILNKTADLLSEVKDKAGSDSAGFAMIGIDAPLHGRRAKSTDSPEDLVFNLLNPRASRDNLVQGVADKLQLVRLIKAFDLDDKTSPTKKAIKFDPKNIYYLGHSQGASEGVPFLAVEPSVRGAVLSGAGGYMLGTFLEKTRPRNVAGLIKLVLADPHLGTTHPLLNLLQLFYEEVDSVNYGKALFNTPPSGQEPKHVFMTRGVADGYTPSGTTDALIWAMGMRKVAQDAQRCGDTRCTGTENCKTCKQDCGECTKDAYCGDGKCGGGENCRNCPGDCPKCPLIFPTDVPPVKGNWQKGGKKTTIGVAEYASDGTYDDHQVLFRNPAAKAQCGHFLGSAVWDKDGVPTIPKK